MRQILLDIYFYLFEEYGPQGWWPLVDYNGCNPTKTGTVSGYHPGNYDFPKTQDQIFEIGLGAILTQNTGWPQVEKVLKNLQRKNCLNPEHILKMDNETLVENIKPAGYFNQKAQKVKIFTKYFITLARDQIPIREELLALWGVGPETADSVLLYGFKVPTFVVDAYTRRILNNLGIINEKYTYDGIKALFEKNLPQDIVIYQEYHALIVEHAKRFYYRGADYKKCPLLQRIER